MILPANNWMNQPPMSVRGVPIISGRNESLYIESQLCF